MKDAAIHIPNSIIKQGLVLAGSIVGYHLGKAEGGIEPVPATLFGGFVGTLLGEILLQNETSRD